MNGLMAEFASADALVRAARQARELGFERVEAYAPFPVPGLGEAIGFTRPRVPEWTLAGGVVGALLGWLVQWYSAVIAYPLNIGGRPLDSWPAFIPVIFECTVLGAALAAASSMLWLNGLPRLRHPVFDAPGFDCATRDRFFLCLVADEPAFGSVGARRFLEGLGPLAIVEVPR
jgi:Protein of unknown function (DUF3341)